MPMNWDYIARHPEVNGGDDYVTKIITRQVTDEDGVLLDEDFEKTTKVGKEPPFIKLYTDCMLTLNNIDSALSAPLIAFGNHMTYANDKSIAFRHIVRTDRLVREDVARRCGVTDDMVKKWVKKFVETDIFIPIVDVQGRKSRGVYYVNPWVIGKGEWKDIKKLRGEFVFSNDEAKIGSCIIDSQNNARQIYVQNNTKGKISQSRQKQIAHQSEQMTISDYPEFMPE